MDKKVDFHKAEAFLLQDRSFLVVHEQGKKFYISPDGVNDQGETPEN